jgi:arsenite-transporting ATPase
MDVEVEPVENVDEGVVPAGIEATEYVLYGGKGGVGKTTMAAATGLASARDDTATLVVSTDPAHSLSDSFDTDVPPEPRRIREDIPLYAAEIDPETALAETGLGEEVGEMVEGPFGDLLGGGPDADELSMNSTPGADEVAAIQFLLELFEDPRYERVVVDTAPTGHTLRLLELPELLDSMVGRLLRIRERVGGLLGGLSDALGDEQPSGPDLDEFAERIERLRGVLTDPERTDFRVVTVPEEASVREAQRLIARLSEFQIPVGTVVVNRVMQAPDEVADVETEFLSPNHTDCEFCARRWEVQQGALASAQELFRDHEVRRVPLLAEEVRGERMLRVVAACLES